jgi:inosine-uridine nucleoside N-ribohydrolase
MDFSPVFTLPDGVDTDAYAQTIQRLKKPAGPVDMVLDTDTYNEIDDQYAIAYMLASQKRGQVHVKGIFAAPFKNHHAENTKEGMERSYDEILRVLEMTGHSDLAGLVFQGADRFLPDEQTPVDSPAARELIRLAMEHTTENPLYVVCIAAPTNVASAILLEPKILDRIVVVWSGGVGLGWPDCHCFNGGQSVPASRVVMGSGVPLVLTPGRSVADRLLTTGPELEYWLRGKNRFCDYIVDRTIQEAEQCYGGKVWSRPLTDVVPVSWVVGGDFLLDRFESRPLIEYDYYYSFDPRRPMMRYVYYIKRDELMEDLFEKLASL